MAKIIDQNNKDENYEDLNYQDTQIDQNNFNYQE